VNEIPNFVHEWCRRFLTFGHLWTGVSENAVHRSHRLLVKPMKSADWPSDPLGPSWPSFPSIPEWLEMLRRGIDPFARPELEAPGGTLGFTRVSRREVHENHVLATRIVSNVIVGIRSSEEVPKKFLRYFQYGGGFLILTVRYNLPIGLVRFLLGRWCVKPFSLWLRRAVSFKSYLKKVPISLVKASKARLDEYRLGLYPTRAESCTPLADDSSEYYSDGSSELD